MKGLKRRDFLKMGMLSGIGVARSTWQVICNNFPLEIFLMFHSMQGFSSQIFEEPTYSGVDLF